MNTLPSMDRHIQQTNDRLQCIKQVCIKNPLAPFRAVKDGFWKQRNKGLHFLSFPILLSVLTTLYGHQFFLPLAAVTQIMLHGVRERERGREVESEIWQRTREETSKRHATPPPPLLSSLYTAFLTPDAHTLSPVVILLKCFFHWKLLGESELC